MTSVFSSITISTIMEEAFERAGVELRTAYDLRTGIRSLNFLLAEWANKGLNLWTIDSETITCIPGQTTYALPPDTIDIIEAVSRQTITGQTSDLSLERISVSQYAQIPDKTASGLPLEYYVDRLAPVSNVTLWPVPDQNYSFVYWRLRAMSQIGTIGDQPDMPFRLIPALTAGLAFYIACKKPESAARVPILQTLYEQCLDDALGEDRDRASVFFVPDPMWR